MPPYLGKRRLRLLEPALRLLLLTGGLEVRVERHTVGFLDRADDEIRAVLCEPDTAIQRRRLSIAVPRPLGRPWNGKSALKRLNPRPSAFKLLARLREISGDLFGDVV